MKGIAIGLVLLCLALAQVCAPVGLQAQTVPISGTSYVEITNFSGWYMGGAEHQYPTQWNGFFAFQAKFYQSVPTITAEIENFVNPGQPPAGTDQNGLLFQCQSGNANIGDVASASPFLMIGEEPWYQVEFDWDSNLSASEAPYLRLEVAGAPWSSDTFDSPPEWEVVWSLWPGAGPQSGQVVLDLPGAGLDSAVYFQLVVEPVPEPSALVTLLCGLTGLCGSAWRARRLS